MKHLLVVLLTVLAFIGHVCGQTEISIVPRPMSVTAGTGSFHLDQQTKLVADDKDGHELAQRFRENLSANIGLTLEIVKKKPLRNYIAFLPTSNAASHSNTNGFYALRVEKDVIQMDGLGPGRFYALQSLLQLIPPGGTRSAEIPVVTVLDKPRFRYRGMHLDVARHFMPVEFVKKYIDLMSQYKFNYFHWHLTDDQGWRIEIRKYPKLTSVGSKRPETVKERNLTPYIGDGIPVEGFYTQEQIKDVVAYAKARYITVIPEIELPGHASAALAAYPQFGCKADYTYKVQTTWGIFKEVYCPADATFKFLEDILDETIALFPDSSYIHIGGDEVLKDHWKESAFVQQLKQREGLKDEYEVQSYFVRRIEKHINARGKKMIGWDEILEGGLAPNAVVMSWRGTKGGIEAAKLKHDVIMTPTDYAYLDYGQGDPAYEPLNIGSYIPLTKVYSFEPVPQELTTDEAKYIIGGQGNVWTEYMKTPDKVEYMAFPRMLALAEVLWSEPARDFADFSHRLSAILPRLDKQNVNYRIPEPGGLRNMIVGDGKATVELIPAKGTQVYYTLDGSAPDESSSVYTQPIPIELKPDEKAEVKTIIVNAKGRKSSVYAATIIRKALLEPVEPAAKRPGVNYALFVPSNAFAQDTPPQNGESKSLSLLQFAKVPNLKDSFGVTFEGFIKVPQDEVYEFQIDSTWDRSLEIDGQSLIDEAGTKDRAVISTIIPLKAGWHKIRVHYDHRGGEMAFRVRWGIKGQGLRQIDGGELVH